MAGGSFPVIVRPYISKTEESGRSGLQSRIVGLPPCLTDQSTPLRAEFFQVELFRVQQRFLRVDTLVKGQFRCDPLNLVEVMRPPFFEAS